MATTVTTTPTTLDTGTTTSIDVGNTGSVAVTVTARGRDTRIRPGQAVSFRTGGTAVTAVVAAGTGTVTVTTSGAAGPAGGSSSGSSSGGVSASTATYSRGATSGVRAKLARGSQGFSTCIQVIGDSTGTDTTEWFGVLVRKLAAANPTHTLLWRPWNTTTQWYDQPTQLQAGTGNGGGDRYALCGTAGGTVSGAQMQHAGSAQLPASTSSQDLDLVARIRPDSWAPGGSAAVRTILARWQGAGSRSWTFYLDEAGKLGFQWSADGTATSGTVVSTAVVPFTGTADGWVRVQFDADNGASGNTATFQTSTDGATWTTLGTAVTTATAATVFAGTIVYSYGSRGSSLGADFLLGRTYWVEAYGVLSGTTRYSLIPPLPDPWNQITTADSVAFGGAPVILALVGSASGQNTTYFDETARKLRLNAAHGQDVVFLSSGHNETHSGFVTTMTAWVASVRTRQPGVPIVVLSQNPVFLGSLFSSAAQVSTRYKRSAELMTAISAQPSVGVYPLDVYPAFDLSLAGLQQAMEADGTHPRQDDGSGTSGSELWGGYVAAQLFGVA